MPCIAIRKIGKASVLLFFSWFTPKHVSVIKVTLFPLTIPEMIITFMNHYDNQFLMRREGAIEANEFSYYDWKA